MNVQTQFSKYAEHYGDYNVIQRQVVDKLLEGLHGKKPSRILDLGCGDGTLYKALTWRPEYFLAVDFVPRMLELHPKEPWIECIYGDFNDPAFFDHLQFLDFDRILSASALQWAENLDNTLNRIAMLKAPVSLALFTSNTFKTLLNTADISSLLSDADRVIEKVNRYFDVKTEVIEYHLTFGSTREMFRYIKRSGVSAGRNILNYKETKQLLEKYPLPYLEFEVLFIQN